MHRALVLEERSLCIWALVVEATSRSHPQIDIADNWENRKGDVAHTLLAVGISDWLRVGLMNIGSLPKDPVQVDTDADPGLEGVIDRGHESKGIAYVHRHRMVMVAEVDLHIAGLHMGGFLRSPSMADIDFSRVRVGTENQHTHRRLHPVYRMLTVVVTVL